METSSETGVSGRTSVRLDAEALLREMALRGLNQEALAEEAGISQPTVSSACRGEAISARSAAAIRAALDRIPPAPMSDLVVA